MDGSMGAHIADGYFVFPIGQMVLACEMREGHFREAKENQPDGAINSGCLFKQLLPFALIYSLAQTVAGLC